MNKKNNRRQTTVVSKPNQSYADDNEVESKNLLHNIHRKLDSSAALNGGFDRLLYKIDSIENSQNQIVGKVNKIHEAIYDPDDGLFSRIAANKAASAESISEVQKQIVEISSWQKHADQTGIECEEKTDEFHSKLQRLESSVQNVESFHKVSMSVIKWAGVAVGGGLVTLLFKIFLNAIKQLP
jgi:hypothetical protein